MKQFNNALSNKVYLNSDNKVIKEYSKDAFKSIYDCQEGIVLDKLGYSYKLHGDTLEMDYIDNNPFIDNEITNEDLINVANALKNLHKLNTDGVELSNFEKVYEDLLSEDEATEEFPVDGNEYYLSMQAFDILESGKQVILHNDVVEGNLLKVNNEIKLIDFEYSGLGNRIFDIASFITERELTIEQKEFFIDQFDNINNEELNTVCAFLQIFWTRWALFKYKDTNKEIYKKIADWKYKEYLKIK